MREASAVGDSGRGVTSAALLAGFALALPFWVGRWVPLTDLPLHLGVASVLLHHGDPAWGFAPHFVPEWGELTPYWTYYLALIGLGSWLPVETASRVVLTAYALAFPWAGMALCRAFGRPAWVGLLAAPLALGASLYLGFVSHCLGVVLAVVCLALVEAERERPKTTRGTALALLALVLFFTHVQPLALLLACATAVVLASDSDWRRRARTLLPLAPAAGLAAVWGYVHFLSAREAGHGRYNFGPLGRTGARFASPAENLRALPEALAGSFQDGSDTLLLLAWAAAVAWLVVRRDRDRIRARLALPAAVALAAYFLAPLAITGQWYINRRFALPAALFALLLVPASAPRRPGTALALALTVLTAANAVRQHARFDREAAPFEAMLEALPPRSHVLGLMHDNRGGVLDRWPYLHFEQYAMVRRGGVASNSLAKSPPFPLRLRRPSDLPAPDVFHPDTLRPARHLPHYDVVLTRGAPDVSVLDGRAVLLRAEGPWRLWRVR